MKEKPAGHDAGHTIQLYTKATENSTSLAPIKHQNWHLLYQFIASIFIICKKHEMRYHLSSFPVVCSLF